MTSPDLPTHRAAAELTVQALHDILQLRTDVFVVEQECAYPEVDGRDLEPGTRHLWFEEEALAPAAERRSNIVAYLRVLDDGSARRIGRVVTRPDCRGRGLAAQLVHAAVAAVPGPWTLESQSHLVHFYEGLGFTVTGPEYLEDGIPHVPMRREMSA